MVDRIRTAGMQASFDRTRYHLIGWNRATSANSLSSDYKEGEPSKFYAESVRSVQILDTWDTGRTRQFSNDVFAFDRCLEFGFTWLDSIKSTTTTVNVPDAMNTIDFKTIKPELFGTDELFEKNNLALVRLIQEWLGVDGLSCFQIPGRARMACSLSSRS